MELEIYEDVAQRRVWAVACGSSAMCAEAGYFGVGRDFYLLSGLSVTYRTVVADPPWQTTAGRSIGGYEMAAKKQLFVVKNAASRKLPYETLSVEQICEMKPPTDPAAHLYLWTINSHLPHAFEVMRAWGFKYSTTLVWAKRPMGGGLGGCYGLATEYVLFGRKGKLAAKDRIGRNWFDWKRPYDERGKPRHSAKPKEFFEMVERISPGPYLEMFARSPREGWSVFGNEVSEGVSLSACG